jgi:hypothetical protein
MARPRVGGVSPELGLGAASSGALGGGFYWRERENGGLGRWGRCGTGSVEAS